MYNRHGVAHFPELEKELACWVREKSQGGFGISTNVICHKAKLIAKKSGLEEEKKIELQNIGVTSLWNEMDFKLDAALQLLRSCLKTMKINCSIFNTIISNRKQHNFQLRHIGNADHTPLTL